MGEKPYRVQFEGKAATQLRKLDPQTQKRIIFASKLLGQNPKPQKAKQLVGCDGRWRVRVGDYRIIYSIEDSVLLVLVATVGHRRDAYKF